MQKIKNLFYSSALEMKNLRNLVIIALFIALTVIVDTFRIEITKDLWITFDFLAFAMIGMMFGPVACMSAGFTTDIIAYIMRPSGPFMLSFTVVTMLCGLTYGLLLYKNKPTVVRCILAKGIVNIVWQATVNTLNLFVLYGTPLAVLFPTRLLKNAILLPIEIFMLVAVGGMVAKIAKPYVSKNHL